ncbi:flagellar protein flhE [Mangrovibacter phragmitis]|jgi:flagellar protein FlhE|uniref:Flagellar protein flhE n=1 Tax=Mangrovibacter phragmitis TaxID=1691903 RepID=A0A1B7L871_9ENTR|nr:flagellar protein FlhE [Mangrovibacter phragmitis]OAT78579.1 flagellar protein flhE [Mangrovibacter phragmitis]
MRVRDSLFTLLCLPLLVQAAGEGSWQAESMGAALSHRGVVASSKPLAPPHKVKGVITQVYWRYSLFSIPPDRLEVKLCTQTQCVIVDGQQGVTSAFAGQPANQPFYFVWGVYGQGVLYPVMRVRANQVIVNYR